MFCAQHFQIGEVFTTARGTVHDRKKKLVVRTDVVLTIIEDTRIKVGLVIEMLRHGVRLGPIKLRRFFSSCKRGTADLPITFRWPEWRVDFDVCVVP